jgi:hypothetical protein
MKACVLFAFLFFAVLTLPEKLCAQAAVPGSKVDSMIRKSRLAASVTGSIPSDTIIDGLRKKLRQRQQDQSPIDGMPNAFKMNLGPDVYEGNNGRGQDIFRSQLDNMAILKPDSSFNWAMPNSIRVPQMQGTLPGAVTIQGNKMVLPGYPIPGSGTPKYRLPKK